MNGKVTAIEQWDSSLLGEMTLAAIRSRHVPEDKYLFGVKEIAGGEVAWATGHRFRCYVLVGSIAFKYGESRIVLKSGQLASLPDGQYELTGLVDATFVRVWDR